MAKNIRVMNTGHWIYTGVPDPSETGNVLYYNESQL